MTGESKGFHNQDRYNNIFNLSAYMQYDELVRELILSAVTSLRLTSHFGEEREILVLNGPHFNTKN